MKRLSSRPYGHFQPNGLDDVEPPEKGPVVMHPKSTDRTSHSRRAATPESLSPASAQILCHALNDRVPGMAACSLTSQHSEPHTWLDDDTGEPITSWSDSISHVLVSHADRFTTAAA